MANEIVGAFGAAWQDGPTSSPYWPEKSVIREVGETIQREFDALTISAEGKWASFATKAAMDADLNYALGTEARVYGDATVGNRGVYIKSGPYGSGSWTYAGPLPDPDTTNLTARADQRPLQRLEIAVDGGKVLFPETIFWSVDENSATSPADGSKYWEADLQTSDLNVRFYYLDLTKIGVTNPIVTVNNEGSPKVDTAGLIQLGYSINGVFTSSYPAVGDTPTGASRNVFAAGKYPDCAWLFTSPAGGASVVDAHANLQALGFTRAVVSPINPQLFYGGDLPEETKAGDQMFGRVVIYSPTSQFGDPQLYPRHSNGPTAGTATAFLEKIVSSTVRIYQFRVTIGAGQQATSFLIGTNQGSNKDCQIVGGQVAVGPVAKWIMRSDHGPDPALDTPMLGPSLYLVNGRETSIYLPNLIAHKRDGKALEGELFTVGADLLPHARAGLGAIAVDPAKLGASVRIDMRTRGAGQGVGVRQRADLSVSKKTIPYAASPRILAIGDSLTNRRMLEKVSARLTAFGLTPTFIGTMATAAGTEIQSDESGPLGEGREGWAFTDFIYKRIDGEAAPVTNWPAYLAANKATRLPLNPFLRTATGGDASSGPSQIAYNGYVFDPAYYATQTSQAAPHVVVVGVGTNDAIEQGGSLTSLVADVTDGLRVMIAQIRAAWGAGVKIGWWMPTRPRAWDSDEAAAIWAAAIRAGIKYIRQLGDANVHIIPVWAHQSPTAGWYMDVAADTATGVKAAPLADTIHLGADGLAAAREQAAEALACWVANVA